MKRRDNIFDSSGLTGIEESRFDLSHSVRTTFNMGKLIPVRCFEVLPGDRINLSFVNMLRFMPMIAPVMDRVRVTTDVWFVPNRILCDTWEDFITGVGVDGPTVGAPYIRLGNGGVDTIPQGTLATYLGIPAGQYDLNTPINISPYPFAAYYKIYDEWYRAQNFIDPILDSTNALVPGNNTANWENLVVGQPLTRAWEHDYFTSALPTSQQYDAGVQLPLIQDQSIPVEYVPGANAGDGTWFAVNPTTGAVDTTSGTIGIQPGPSPLAAGLHDFAGNPIGLDPNGTLQLDLNAEAVMINDLRKAIALQVFLERSLRGGLRYTEQIWTHFRTKSSDARLQRPELIGRRNQNVTVSEVLATAQSSNDASTAEIPVGAMAGHGISVGTGDNMSYYAEEHGFIMVLISVLPDTSYQDGIAKMFTRLDRLDYAWPSFAHIGEQEILNKEVMAHDTTSGSGYDLEGTFGYIPRYDEYRYLPSLVTGDFAHDLSYWTLGRIFDPAHPPALNADFINSDPRSDIFAVLDLGVDHVLLHTIFDISAIRKLPRYGIPSGLGG